MPLTKEGYVYFGSGAGNPFLSNFSAARFEYKGYDWPTSEHCYQAMSKVPPEQWFRFAVGGDLSELQQGLKLVFSEREYAKKLKHYGPKSSRPAMPGIVAKMAVSPKVAAKLGIGLLHGPHAYDYIHRIFELFSEILMCKYKQNVKHREALESTGSKVLVEFSRGAERENKRGRPPLWTGMVVGGEVVGHNLQGLLQMTVRSRLLYEIKAKNAAPSP